jgi:hypothetical protein
MKTHTNTHALDDGETTPVGLEPAALGLAGRYPAATEAEYTFYSAKPFKYEQSTIVCRFTQITDRKYEVPMNR